MPPSSFQPKPSWIRVRPPSHPRYFELRRLSKVLKLNTVCEESKCPNIAECWSLGTATFMVMGESCTRACRFCHVKTAKLPGALDPGEPFRVAQAVRALGLDYVVVTSVDRDDLEDGGAGHIAQTIRMIHRLCPRVLVEVLIPDFRADIKALEKVVEAGPVVVAHNIETCERLTSRVRDPRCGYRQSLEVLRRLKELSPSLYTKSSLMVGLGESLEEVEQSLKDLLEVGVSIVTIGQYLRPSLKHLDVKRYYTPQEFAYLEKMALNLGFEFVASGPLVRSSYRAAELFVKGVRHGDTG